MADRESRLAWAIGERMIDLRGADEEELFRCLNSKAASSAQDQGTD